MTFYKKNFPNYDKMHLFIEGQGTALARLLRSYPGREFVQNNDDFTISLAFLAAYLIRLDRKVNEVELKFVGNYFARINDGNTNQGKMASNFVRYLLKKKVEYDEICITIKKYVTKPAKIQLVHFLCELSRSDHEFHAYEHKYIQVVGFKIGLRKQEISSILQIYLKIESKRRGRKKVTKAYISQRKLKSACEILGIRISCTKEELKKAYRKLARLHHPDKVSYLGDSHVEKARERFDEIADAYRYLKNVSEMK